MAAAPTEKFVLRKTSLMIAFFVFEPPNMITLLHKAFEGSCWSRLLIRWEDNVFSILIAILVALLFHFGVRKKEMIPSGFQNFLEIITEQLMNVIYGILGTKGRKYVPFLGTLFIYILCMNLFGLIPLMKSPSVNLNITVAMAICVFVLVQYLNIKNMGIFGFIYHMAGSPKNALGWIMVPLMFPLELLTQISRPVTYRFVFLEIFLVKKVLIGYFTLLGVTLFALLHLPIPAGFPLQIPFMLLGILTSVMQALVFTLLAAVYILLSMPHDEKKIHVK